MLRGQRRCRANFRVDARFSMIRPPSGVPPRGRPMSPDASSCGAESYCLFRLIADFVAGRSEEDPAPSPQPSSPRSAGTGPIHRARRQPSCRGKPALRLVSRFLRMAPIPPCTPGAGRRLHLSRVCRGPSAGQAGGRGRRVRPRLPAAAASISRTERSRDRASGVRGGGVCPAPAGHGDERMALLEKMRMAPCRASVPRPFPTIHAGSRLAGRRAVPSAGWNRRAAERCSLQRNSR